MAAIMNAPVQIRKPDVIRALRERASARGLTITELVETLLADDSARHTAEIQEKIHKAKAIIAEFQALPTIGPLLTDDDFYDEDGLPK